MTASWVEEKKGYNPVDIAQRLESRRIINDDGSVAFGLDLLMHSDDTLLLQSMLKLSAWIPDLEKSRIVRQATFKAGEKGAITADSLLKACNDLERQYLRQPPKRYQIVASISINTSCRLKRYVISGCAIRFTSRLSKAFYTAHEKILYEARYSLIGAPPKHYTYSKIGVSAKSVADAANQALDGIDLLRGIWNLYFNRGGWRHSSGKRKPVNCIVLGPVHSLHLNTGALATDSWWYQPEYTGPIDPFSPKNKQGSMYTFTENVRNCLKKSKYADKLQSALIRYVRALDLTDWEDSFLRLWGTLEQLTNTVDGNHTVTVRRASIMWEDRKYHRQILNHLREYRNRSVHQGSESHDIEGLVYQVKRYVELTLEFHLGSYASFHSMGHAAEFMDLPDDKKSLDRRLATLKFAKKYLGHGA